MKLPINYNKADWQTRKEAREQYIKEQNGMCHYCKSSLFKQPPVEILNKPITRRFFPKNFFDYPIHLHHDHVTGITIGAVHCYCNAVLWQYHKE